MTDKVREQTTSADDDAARIADLVVANRILADQGIIDAFGHVSVRSASNDHHFYMSRPISPMQVTPDDIMELDEACNPVREGDRQGYMERFIHGEIYRARPDVQGIVHTHSPTIIAFSISGVALRPTMTMAAFIGGEAPIFEMRDVAGESSDLLITDSRRGAALAGTLGKAGVVLMRGHGDTTVGPSVKLATARAIYAEENARILLDALKLGGPVTCLSGGEAANLDKLNASDRAIARQWEFWRQKAVGS